MKAIVINRYGGPEVLEWAELATPRPSRGEVLVRVRAASVNPVDYKIRSGRLRLAVRRPFPLILGGDMAGMVSVVGDGAGRFQVGDEVYGMAPGALGCYAEYVVFPEALLAPKPARMTMEEAASVPLAGLTALQTLRDLAGLRQGQRVLVNGASGGVGVFAVQLAKALGAIVAGVSGAANESLVRELGAEAWYDYRASDFTQLGARYNVILDAAATLSPAQCRQVMETGGKYISTLPSLSRVLSMVTNPITSRKTKIMLTKPNGPGLDFLRGLIDQGKIKAVIDRTFRINQAAEAHSHIQTGRARGKIVLIVP